MSPDEIFQVIKRQALEILPHIEDAQFTIDKSLQELGANSIDRADVVVQVMEALNLRIPLIEFGEVKNLRALTEVFYRKLNEKK